MVSKREASKKMTLLLMLVISWLCLTPALGLDISHILGQHPELSTFSNYLTQTHLAHDIDSLHKITLLVVANSDMGPLSGKPMDQIKKILSAHVLLEYYDISKLNRIKGRTMAVSTLLHSNNRINVSVSSVGDIIKFQSTANSVPVKLVRVVECEPKNGVSVVQISAPIIMNQRKGGAAGAPAPLHSTRVLAESPKQQSDSSPSSNAPEQGNHGPTPSSNPPPSQSHAPESQQHSNSPPPSNSHNAPQPSPNSNKSSPPPASSPDSSESPKPSKKADSPTPSPAPAEDDADTPASDTKGDSPSSSSSPTSPSSDSPPSTSPSSDSPSSAPGDSASSSADAEKKHKSSAFGITPPPAACISALFISLLIGKLL